VSNNLSPKGYHIGYLCCYFGNMIRDRVLEVLKSMWIMELAQIDYIRYALIPFNMMKWILTLLVCILVFLYSQTQAQSPTITSFSPVSGSVGTLVTIVGTNLGSPTTFTIGNANAIVESITATELVGLVMPGAVTGTVSITTANGIAKSGAVFTITTTPFPNMQQGGKVTGTGATGTIVNQGWSVCISADGNTAIAGGPVDNNNIGGAWIYTRTNGMWTQ